jgi:hypothetical protein
LKLTNKKPGFLINFYLITSTPVPFSLRRRGAGDEVHGKSPGACPGIRVQDLPWGSYQLIVPVLKDGFKRYVNNF